MSKSLEGSVAAARNLKDEVDAKLNQKAVPANLWSSTLRTRGGARRPPPRISAARGRPKHRREAGPERKRGQAAACMCRQDCITFRLDLVIEDYRDPESIYAQLVPRGGQRQTRARQAPQVGVDGEARRQATLGDDGRGKQRALALPRRRDLERGRAGRLLLGGGGLTTPRDEQ